MGAIRSLQLKGKQAQVSFSQRFPRDAKSSPQIQQTLEFSRERWVVLRTDQGAGMGCGVLRLWGLSQSVTQPSQSLPGYPPMSRGRK